MKKICKIFTFLSFFFVCSNSFSQVLEKIIVKGNERVPKETIVMFSELKLGEKLINIDKNKILKNIYNSNFFENVSVQISDKNIIITLIELPIVQNIEIKGIKAKKNKELVEKNLILKPRSSYNEYLLAKEKESIISNLKSNGYYFAKVETYTELLDNNSVNIIHEIDLGNKGKIKKISFIGEKVFKDR